MADPAARMGCRGLLPAVGDRHRAALFPAVVLMTARKAAKEPEAPKYPWSCGFCAPADGKCHDTRERCRGVWPGFVPVTPDNPRGEAVCECAAATHHAEAVIYAITTEDVQLPVEVASHDAVA